MVTFNGIDRLIEVTDPSTLALDAEKDIYSRWKDWVKQGDNGKYAPALRTFGGDTTTEGQNAPKYFFLTNNWRVFINNGNVVSIGLNLYSDDFTSAYIVALGSGVSDRNSDAVSVNSKLIEYGFFNGGVTYDKVNGVPGTGNSDGVPIGSALKPSNNEKDAHDIAIARGFGKIYVKGDMLLEDPTVDWMNFEFVGESPLKTLIDVDPIAEVFNCEFYECTITGTLDGSSQIRDSIITGLDFVDGFITRCALGPDPIMLGMTTNANIFNCFSTIPGMSTPIVNMNGTGILALRHYNGGVKLINYNGSGSHSIDLARGTVILDSASITSGTFVVRGVGKLVDENGKPIYTTLQYDEDYNVVGNVPWNGGVTIINELLTARELSKTTDRIHTEDIEAIIDGVWDAPLTGATHNLPTSAGRRLRQIAGGVITDGNVVSATVNTVTLNGNASSTDGAYDPAIITILAGTGLGQSRLILEYVGNSKKAILDRNWKTIPDNTSEYAIYPSIGREHINEGLLRGATANTAILNDNASPNSDAYKQQLIFLRSGKGEDQVNVIVDYDHNTKTVTVEKPWSVVPDNTTGYVILPVHVHELEEMNSWTPAQRDAIIAWSRNASDNAEQANLKL